MNVDDDEKADTLDSEIAKLGFVGLVLEAHKPEILQISADSDALADEDVLSAPVFTFTDPAEYLASLGYKVYLAKAEEDCIPAAMAEAEALHQDAEMEAEDEVSTFLDAMDAACAASQLDADEVIERKFAEMRMLDAALTASRVC